MLNFNEFQEHIKNTILDYLPEEFSDAKVDLQQVAKNNEMLTGIIIHQEKINISPTIYLDPFYKDYLSGSKDLDTVMGEIGQIYVQNVPDKNFDVSRITDFELVKDRIIAKVICMENNEKLLEGKPYRQMADLAVTYHVLLSKENGMMTVPISDKLMQRWGIVEDVLFTAAKNGMSNLTPVTIKSMTETLMEMCGEEQFELMGVPTEADEMMYIMSNTEKVNGAAAIIDPNNMDLARSYMQDDFYILPSSVHEVLLVKQNQMSVEELEDMVKTVNASAVALQDRLSDHVYKYDFARHEIYRADQEQQRQAELNAEQARTHATGR